MDLVIIFSIIKINFLEVKNETKFDVQLLGVKIFSIRSKGVEKYFNNKLISFKSETQQNDKKKFVNLEVTDKKTDLKLMDPHIKERQKYLVL